MYGTTQPGNREKQMKVLKKVVIILPLALVAILGILLLFVKITRGSGRAYPDVSTAPLFTGDSLEVVAALPLPPGNVAVSRDGRIFFNYHYLGSTGDDEGSSVFELVGGLPRAYPEVLFQEQFHSTLGMLIDQQDRLWIIDPATIESGRRTRIMAFDLATDTLVYDFSFPQGQSAFAQDIQVTADGRYLVAADTGLFDFIPAHLVVLDLESDEYHDRLKGHHSTGTQNWRITGPDGKGVKVFGGLIDWQAGVDGITISHDQKWLYYGGINHDTMFRLPLAGLLDDSISDKELETMVEAVGTKPLSDGLSIDVEGNVYITDIENGGVARMSPGGELQTLVKDTRVRWSDGISFGPDDYIYFTDSAIPVYLTPGAEPPEPNVHQEHGPYHIFRFKNDIPGWPGS
jgi:sugar lactone lactonase YvrE